MSPHSQQTTNNVEIKLPAWLQADIFEHLLKDNFKDFKAIKTFNARPGTKPGDNYASIMLLIELEVELTDNSTKSTTYMLKIPHESEAYKETLGNNKNNIFDVERNMFLNYVQEFKQLYNEVGLDIEFGAKCYKLDVPHDHVLLEDLKAKGYQPTNRQAGLDEEHTLALLKKLAQWHAASAVRVATKGVYPVQVTEGLFTEDAKLLVKTMTDDMVKYLLEAIKSIEGHEEYYNDIKCMEGHIMENALRVGVIDPNEFNVLNHGDCWLSNLMFKHDKDTGNLLDVSIVDYQMCKYGSVAIDLLYFLISSPRLELKLNRFDFFVKYYHDQLIKHLKLLNYAKKLPSLIDIHTSLLKNGIWGYCTLSGVMAGCLLESTETASFDNVFANTPEAEEFKTLLFSGKQYKEHIKVILPWLQNRGALQLRNIISD